MAYCTIILVILLILHTLSFHGSHSLEITLVQTLNSRRHEEFEYSLLSTCPFKTLDLTFQAPRYTKVIICETESQIPFHQCEVLDGLIDKYWS